ncbi:MAG: hypothetical protein ACRD0Q_10735 [Acidimicrobiales bacterium]
MRRRLVFGLGLALLLGACGGGTSDEASTTTTEAAGATTTRATSTRLAAACKADVAITRGFNQVFSDLPFPEGDEPPSVDFKAKLKAGYAQHLAAPLAEFQANAPAEITTEANEAIAVVKRFADSGDFMLVDNDEFNAKVDKIDAYMYGNCDGTKQAVTAVDYGYTGLPAQITAGLVRFKLQNTGTEHHEITVLARKAGVTETFDQILALPEEQGRAKVDSITQVDSAAGQAGYTSADLKPGRYLMTCFIPKGTVGDKEGDGPPHFTLGMKQEITVS